MVSGTETLCPARTEPQPGLSLPRLTLLNSEIAARLAFFSQLDSVTQALSSPGNKFVMTDAFESSLEKIDHSLAYLQEHVRNFDEGCHEASLNFICSWTTRMRTVIS